MPYYDFRCPQHGVYEERLPSDGFLEASLCPICGDYAPRVYTPPLRAIIRPSGYRLRPGDRGFGDFRRELELGEIRDDPAPLTFTPDELARMDAMPVALPADPARDAALAQLVHQHWTEDLSDDTVRRRELEAQHHATRDQ